MSRLLNERKISGIGSVQLDSVWSRCGGISLCGLRLRRGFSGTFSCRRARFLRIYHETDGMGPTVIEIWKGASGAEKQGSSNLVEDVKGVGAVFSHICRSEWF